MNIYLSAFVAMLGTSVVVLIATAVPAARHLRDLVRNVRSLAMHPAIAELRSANQLGEKVHSTQASLASLRARSAHIGELVGELAASSALLRLNADRVGFATRLLLGTFVPTLRSAFSE